VAIRFADIDANVDHHCFKLSFYNDTNDETFFKILFLIAYNVHSIVPVYVTSFI